MIDAPLFPFDSPALAHRSGGNDAALIDVLLEFGADPNRRTDWWAGGFHPLHGASPAIAERLIRAGATVDACAAAHLDRIDLLRAIRAMHCGNPKAGYAAVARLLLEAGAEPPADISELPEPVREAIREYAR